MLLSDAQIWIGLLHKKEFCFGEEKVEREETSL